MNADKPHKQVLVRTIKRKIRCDSAIVSLISQLNRLQDIRTHYSCQGGVGQGRRWDDGRAYVQFDGKGSIVFIERLLPFVEGMERFSIEVGAWFGAWVFRWDPASYADLLNATRMVARQERARIGPKKLKIRKNKKNEKGLRGKAEKRWEKS
jgi:hypothetical protein